MIYELLEVVAGALIALAATLIVIGVHRAAPPKNIEEEKK